MMNPIFSRRYKGSRPNIMPTSIKRPNYLKSMSTSGTSSMSSLTSPGGSSLTGDSSDGEIVSPTEKKSPEDQFSSSMKPKQTKNHSKFAPSPSTDSTSSRLLAQQLLASKQNMLAQVNLTHSENKQRSKAEDHRRHDDDDKPSQFVKMSKMKQSFSTENFPQTSGRENSKIQKSPTVHGEMTLCDLDDDEFNGQTHQTELTSTSYSVSNSRISRPNLNQRVSKASLDVKQWRDLKKVVCGTGNFHDGWIGQGFFFDNVLPFGLVQKKGGPCGVLAVVQSLVIRNLLFGSPFDTESLTKLDRKRKLVEIEAFLARSHESAIESIRKHRVNCLVNAVAEIIWNCGRDGSKEEANRESLIMFSDFRIQPEVICIKGKLELEQFLQASIHRFDCISLVYSAVLTRGIQAVKDDMDFENCSLIGQHGYCSQELVNLLAIGSAISNTFDNEISLDGKILKGIPSKCDIGLLSLFEHYDSIKVGNFLKSPKYPVWIVCSESHFSVLFSTCAFLCEEKASNQEKYRNFDLYYFDGLARQDNIVRLSIALNGGQQQRLTLPETQFSKLTLSKDDELVPPLEKCIRTKWPGAGVDWNETEPIL